MQAIKRWIAVKVWQFRRWQLYLESPGLRSLGYLTLWRLAGERAEQSIRKPDADQT